ncbi:hypothetical protein N752_24215 [Desulforamulus aquiferis]|nr:hypothetical protein N752_24215 [Desulforamulus aquiferis]
MINLGAPVGMKPMEVAHTIIELVISTITAEIEQMFMEWEQEPSYRVWEVLQKRKLRPKT